MTPRRFEVRVSGYHGDQEACFAYLIEAFDELTAAAKGGKRVGRLREFDIVSVVVFEATPATARVIDVR